MKPIRFDIKIFDMANEKITEPVKYFIELHKTYLTWEGEWYAETPKAENPDDHTLGWKDEYNNFTVNVKRRQICSVEKRFSSLRQLWIVEVEINGYPKSISAYFKKEKDCAVVFDALNKYVFPPSIIQKIKNYAKRTTGTFAALL